ncbi:MAG: hypothetical protein LLG02_04250 [Pelosinus sp.]|nr:hypothetical protein [Pelosinus sp.]
MTVSSKLRLPDTDKNNLLKKYAPYVWLAKGERYYPCSVEYTFQYFNRIYKDSAWSLKTKEDLSSPSATLPYFHGQHSKCSPAPVYAFCCEKRNAIDLVYFFYYAYNRGKELISTMWGNHVGDWEYGLVQLSKDSFKPSHMYIWRHGNKEKREWSDVERHEDHPIIYAAWGSHGVWFDDGNHKYHSTPKLVDECSKGTAWPTWDKLVALDYNNKRSLTGNEYPLWLNPKNEAYSTAGVNPSVPGNGPIKRWGNYHDSVSNNPSWFGYRRLEDGPTGPEQKGILDQEIK